ncbi:Hsp20/alpha crystallin family protein [Bacillus xiapuensis]|uniref:Hsp20/alpha crystallin family protein n=1 Tax=Bacillus xiapuensis TaxID=2014075 RepID=UPI000C23CC8D|nr:Hsp20/alpha crystallin family protein [Bacillus xiapuensis]
MALIPNDPFRQLSIIRKDIDRLFSAFPWDLEGEARQLGNIRVDVHETDHAIIASCDIPGIEKKEDVHIDIENNRLTVSGSINRTHETQDEHMHRRERYSGRFHRTISLPAPVNEEGVKASYKNGVLEITMPKQAQTTKKKIDVDFH